METVLSDGFVTVAEADDAKVREIVDGLSAGKLSVPGLHEQSVALIRKRRKAAEITPENWLDHFCELKTSVADLNKASPAYRKGWDDALTMVRALAKHARGSKP